MSAIDDTVRAIVKRWAGQQDQALEEALGAYHDAHGRFPAYSWIDAPASAASMMFPTDTPATVYCGEARPTGPGRRNVWLTGILNAVGAPAGRDYLEDTARAAGYAVNPSEIAFDCPECGATVTREEETWYDGGEIEWMCPKGHWGEAALDVVVLVKTDGVSVRGRDE